MSKQVEAKGLKIGNGAKISVQSMTNTDTRDITATQSQIDELVKNGCDLVRISVYDEACAKAVGMLNCPVPLCADIHFDYKLAVAAVENGADKLRINPGNIGSAKNVKIVADCAKFHKVPIRIGVNGGSLQREIQNAHGVTAHAMVLSALEHIKLLENAGFYDIVVSLKASEINKTVMAYREMNSISDYPLHLGITEAGFGQDGLIKSCAGLGALLVDGIGDTIRISLTGNPVDEVIAAIALLRAMGLKKGLQIISCPTCGRTCGDVELAARQIKALLDANLDIKIAVMGCVVNGPGEAKEADIGVAFGTSGAALFKQGELLRRIENQDAVSELVCLAKEFTKLSSH